MKILIPVVLLVLVFILQYDLRLESKPKRPKKRNPKIGQIITFNHGKPDEKSICADRSQCFEGYCQWKIPGKHR